MIGQVPTTCQPLNSKSSFALHQINDSGALTNKFNGNIIKVKNTPVDFRVIVTERFLASAVNQNENLRVGSSIDHHSTQKDRLISFGMGITAVYNYSENLAAKALTTEACELSPRTASGNLKSDPAMLKRGEYGISALTKEKNNFTDTTYALGIGLGHRMKQEVLDPTLIEHFAVFLTLSMNKTQKNEAENMMSNSVRVLRKVFERHEH